MPADSDNDEIEFSPAYLPEVRWFIAIGVFLLLATAGGGLRYWTKEEIIGHHYSRGITFDRYNRLQYGRGFTLDEAAQVRRLTNLGALGSVTLAIAVPATIISAIGLWVVRAVNRKRFQYDSLLRQNAIFEEEDDDDDDPG